MNNELENLENELKIVKKLLNDEKFVEAEDLIVSLMPRAL